MKQMTDEPLTLEAQERETERVLDESRVVMMRRVKAMTLAQRLDLFDQLSRDAASHLQAKRIR